MLSSVYIKKQEAAMQVRLMRILRLRYDISLAELARVCGVSSQRISEIELNTEPEITPKTAAKIEDGFANVTEKRRRELHKLRKDYEKYKGSLMDCVEEIGYEL